MAMFGDQEDAVDALADRTPLSELLQSKQQAAHQDHNRSGILVEGNPDVLAKIAKCCQPVPGDEIFGFITRGGGVSVHRADCTNATKLRDEPERVLKVSWANNVDTEGAFSATLQLEALDRQGLLYDLTGIFQKSSSVSYTHLTLPTKRIV